jgi:hypothetical protein
VRVFAGTDRAARREAEKAMARLQPEVDGLRSTQSSVTLGCTLDEWLNPVRGQPSDARPAARKPGNA